MPAECERLGEITGQAYTGDGLLDQSEEDTYLNRPARRGRPGRRRRGAGRRTERGRNGEVLGGVTFAPPGSPLADVAGPHEAEFRMLAVAPEARGTGIGEALVRACTERARAFDGLTALTLSTRPAMRGAQRIHTRLGFVRTPELDWPPNPALTLLTYRLELWGHAQQRPGHNI
ncbi:GNAT family N-acetyltransferase [Streptomyces sp. NPDC059851]|uniref:GNAT family N-acetyltransferase n=1 Tax=Streptomyces sp. NPDC059851 TaxID=3346971 RepID=UPI0036DA7740